jgi:outer membrane protein
MNAILLVAKVLTLAEALSTARAHQPTLRQAQAITDVLRARVHEARAGFTPAINGSASYSRRTNNAQPGQVSGSAAAAGGTGAVMQPSPWNTYDSWALSTSIVETLYDSHQTISKYRASKENELAQEANEKFQLLTVDLGVRTAFFNARATKALVQVAKDTLANQDRHLAQTEGFVKAGTQPEIALAQTRTDRANAVVQVITAENNYEIAKAQLNQVIGVVQSTDYDVADDVLPPIDAEQLDVDKQVSEAEAARPDVISLVKQVRAAELALEGLKGAYGPTLTGSISVTGSATDFVHPTFDMSGNQTGFAAASLASPGWNFIASLTLGWTGFVPYLVWGQVKEGAANLESLKAQLDGAKLQVRLDVETARLAVRAAAAALGAADEALTNAKERLRLAEGRYQAGVGNIIELGDAQVALTSASAQRVSADYNLSTARAQLLRALGRA